MGRDRSSPNRRDPLQERAALVHLCSRNQYLPGQELTRRREDTLRPPCGGYGKAWTRSLSHRLIRAQAGARRTGGGELRRPDDDLQGRAANSLRRRLLPLQRARQCAAGDGDRARHRRTQRPIRIARYGHAALDFWSLRAPTSVWRLACQVPARSAFSAPRRLPPDACGRRNTRVEQRPLRLVTRILTRGARQRQRAALMMESTVPRDSRTWARWRGNGRQGR